MSSIEKKRLNINGAVWGKARDVKRLTGWDSYRLHLYRHTNTIKWRTEIRGKKPNGEPAVSYFYRLDTIPKELILKQAA